jgi:hypothetical protein
MSLDSDISATSVSYLRRFRILVVGKVRQCNSQQNSGQIDTTFNRREARASRRSSMLSSKWPHRSVFRSTSCSCLNGKFRKPRPLPEISTKKFIQMIIVILFSTSILHLDLAKARTCRLSGISFQNGRIRHVYLLKDCMSSGREMIPEIS